ncbi:MAG: hypothetical protein IPJ34_43700 [Myxococcales bacterium]|nr:hypothetical protein [Myxococcales bacterium]
MGWSLGSCTTFLTKAEIEDPQAMIVDGPYIVFMTPFGLYRTLKAGGTVEKLAASTRTYSFGTSSPYGNSAYLAADDKFYYSLKNGVGSGPLEWVRLRKPE